MPITIPEVVDSLDEVAPNLKDLYKPSDDGKYKAGNATDILKSMTLAKQDKAAAVERATKLEQEIKKYEGLDVDEYQALKARKAELDDFDKNHGIDIEKIKTGVEANFTAKLSALKAEAETAQRRYEEKVRDTYIRDAMAKAGVSERGSRFVRSALSDALTWSNSGGDYVPHLLDKDGKPRYTSDMDIMTIDDLLALEKKENPDFFGSAYGGASGTGASGGSSAPNPQTKDPKTWGQKEINDYNNSMNDPKAYIKLMTKKPK